MVQGTGLESLCETGNSADELKEKLHQLFTKDFNPLEVEKRKEILLKNYSNTANVQKLIALVFDMK